VTNGTDRAIIVGIRKYPGLGEPLDGPENDARKVHEWVTSKAGGGVPPQSARLILSSDFGAMQGPLDARPTLEAIQHEFDLLQDEAEKNDNEGNGFRVGRRLYLFFSGHGFEPDKDNVALLMANATPSRGYHVAATLYADYFRRAGIFDEVLLFMDCCRQPMASFPTNRPPYMESLASDAPEKGKWLKAFATKWSRKSREKKIDGVAHGIFTSALLRGLKGEAPRDAAGQITDETLASFLYDHMKDPLTKAELDDPDIPKQPDINYDQDPNNRLVIVGGGASGLRVVFKTRPESNGQELVVSGGQPLKLVLKKAITVPEITADLAPGLYKAEIGSGGAKVLFQVPGDEPGGVTHVAI